MAICCLWSEAVMTVSCNFQGLSRNRCTWPTIIWPTYPSKSVGQWEDWSSWSESGVNCNPLVTKNHALMYRLHIPSASFINCTPDWDHVFRLNINHVHRKLPQANVTPMWRSPFMCDWDYHHSRSNLWSIRPYQVVTSYFFPERHSSSHIPLHYVTFETICAPSGAHPSALWWLLLLP